VLEETIYDIFDPLFITVIKELKEDSFPRFRETKECKKLIKKYHNDTKVVVLKDSLQYNFVDNNYFTTKHVTESDYNIMEMISKRTDWDLLNDENSEVSCVFIHVNVFFLFNNKLFSNFTLFNPTNVRFQIILPFSLKDCVLCTIPSCKNILNQRRSNEI
jgi:hypothetical protein